VVAAYPSFRNRRRADSRMRLLAARACCRRRLES
jgi:hypothetical protein